MKICIVNSFYYPNIVGGAEISVLKLAEQLYKDGNEVYILCTGNENKKEIINGVNVYRIKIRNIYTALDVCTNRKKMNFFKLKIYYLLDKMNFFNFRILMEVLLEINPEVVHINNIYGISPIIWSVCNKINIPTIQTLRDYSLLESNNIILRKIKKNIYSSLSNKVNIITAPSKYTLNKFVENNYFKASKKRVVYNSIDFSQESMEKISKMKKRNINNKVKFVYLGRLTREKGIEYLINSFQKINNDNIELLIAGNGELESYVINSSKYDSRILYLGFLTEKEVEALLEKTDVLIIPSLWPEPFGRVIIEAYKFGMPVIGTINGGIPEVIINNKTGILINPADEKELINSIIYLSDYKNRVNFINNCIKEVTKYNIKNHSKEFFELYKLISK